MLWIQSWRGEREVMSLKAYYSDEKAGITIYHGDCREIMPQLPSVDLVLTDPPYGISYQSNMRVASDKFQPIKNDGSVSGDWILSVKCKVLALFTRWDVLGKWVEATREKLPVRGVVVWYKPGGGLGDLKRSYAPDYELLIYASSDEWNIPGKRHGSVWIDTADSASLYQHPTQKPVGIMNMCIERFGGETVLDPFMGSGTTLRAAKDLGRKAIGIELEEKYCEIAAKRLAQEVLPLEIPEPKPMEQDLAI